MVLVDTNVLLDVATRDPSWFEWSADRILDAQRGTGAAINPVIYTELVPAYASALHLDRLLLPPSRFKRLPLPYTAAAPAARAFAAYRKNGGNKTSPLPDFFIGAHAEAAGLTLLTRDPVRYRRYFPKVTLICP